MLNKSFITVSHSELWLRATYYGLQSVLIFYLISQWQLDNHRAYSIYGAYTGLAFGASVIGGMIGDRWLGRYHSLLLGSLALCVGNYMLFSSSIGVNFFSIALIIFATGLLKPANSITVNSIFNNDAEKNKAFIYFYMIANIGGIIGPLLYGFSKDYTIAKNIHAFFFFITFILFLCSPSLRDNVIKKNNFLKKIGALLFIAICVISIDMLIQDTKILNYSICLLCLFCVAYVIYLYKKSDKDEKICLISLIFPVISSIIFMTLLLQLYSTVISFIKQLDIHLFGLAIPPITFCTLEAIFVLCCSSVLSIVLKILTRLRIKNQESNRLWIGLVCGALAFYCLSLSAINHGTATLVFLIVSIFLLALGEISILPTTISLVSRLSPYKHKNTIMGIFYFSLMLSGFLGGKIAYFA